MKHTGAHQVESCSSAVAIAISPQRAQYRSPHPACLSGKNGAERLVKYSCRFGKQLYRLPNDNRQIYNVGLGEVRNVTVSQSGGKWFASIQTQREVEQSLPTVTTAIGIDVGIARFATMSDASFIAPLNSFKKHQQRLACCQRRMSRKVKFSSNWKKAKARVQQIHTGIANARRDFLHKTTTTISQNHALVCIEDLQVRNMSKSSKGSGEQPGKKLAQKSGLNRSILDQGWGEFRRQLGYKVEWNGGMLLAVPPHHTSQTCPACGHVTKDNRQTQAKFLCVDCGYENHADVVGAINVLALGHRVLACGETAQSGRSMKQVPAEATQAAFASAP